MGKAAELHALLRHDYDAFMQRTFSTLNPGATFLPNWHLQAICHVLYQCWTGDINRLIITLPPRYGKSICTSVALPAFILGHDPTQRIIVTSYGNSLAAQLSNDTRRVMKEGWYKSLFPTSHIDTSKDKEDFFRTTQGGHRLATSTGGAITGLGGDWIIIDDPMKASIVPTELELKKVIDYYTGVLYSRLNNKQTGRIILIMQRIHEEDLAGYLVQQGGWHHLNLPAIAQQEEIIPTGPNKTYTRHVGEALHSAREPLEELASIKEQMGPHAFGAQYQQTPIPIGGGVIEYEKFKTYTELPNQGKGGFTVQSWDTAMEIHSDNSYSVCTTWFCFQNNYYLMHVWRQRLRPADLLGFIHQHAIKYNADLVIIEDHNGSRGLIEILLNHTFLNLFWIRPKESKVLRMITEYTAIHNGNVFIPKSAPWLQAFHTEMVKFPEYKYDDQVDSVSQFLHWARKKGLQAYGGGGRRGLGRPGGPSELVPQQIGCMNGPKGYFY
jgi:predicted phage terminase large subunit-like protein